MAATKEILPKGDYEVANVGPTREWSFNGNDGEVLMTTDQVQFKGYEQYWVDVNRARKSDPPKVGDKINGTISQDEEGKYPPKFNKTKGAGGGGYRGGGGGQSSPGAIWSAAVETAVHVISAYATLTGKKPKTVDEFLKQVEATAPKVNDMVDRLVGKAKPAEKPADTTSSEAGETPAAAAPAKKEVVIEDITDDDLGDGEGW